MLFDTRRNTLEIDHTEMDYVTFGNGTKPLVLIPGLSVNQVKHMAVILSYMYRHFKKDFTIYVFDRKEDIPRGYTIKDIAEDTACAMKKLGLSHVYVYGVSQGGMIGQYLAMEHPELVDKLVLAVTISRLNKTTSEVVSKWIALSDRNDYEGVITDMFDKKYTEKVVRRYRWLFPLVAKITKPNDMIRFNNLARSCLTCDTYEHLDRIKCPVFVIGGMQDKIVTGEASIEIAEKINCNIYMYPKYGHSVYEEAKDFNKRIYEFLINK